MAVNTNIMRLVQLLTDEGFGELASEILSEISLGREIDICEDGVTPSAPGDDAAAEDLPQREPIPEADQLAVALDILRLRLVEPVRRLAEAEKIASLLVASRLQTQVAVAAARAPAFATRFLFVDEDGDRGGPFARSGSDEELKLADEIDGLLTRLAVEAT